MLNGALTAAPWCATYHILLAKGYDNESSYFKEKNLKLAATYAGDRERLFSLIYNQSVVLVEEEEPALSDLNETEEKVLENKVSEDKTEKQNEISEKEDPKEVIIDKDEPAEEWVEPIGEKKNEPNNGNKINFDEVVTYDPLVELKVHEIPPKDIETERIPLDYVAYDPEKELQKLVEDKEKAEEEGSKDFLFWLNNVEPSEPAKGPESAKSPDAVQNLLDQFIATKRNRPIKTKSFYKVEDKADESDTDNMDVVSETLLEIYVDQEYYSKAIEGYNKLSLLNPIKSAYFAARIEEIKQLEKDK